MNDTVLQLRGVTKRFGSFTALDGVCMDIDRGEVIGLIGENGAGKSTLLKVLAGVHSPDGGEMRLNGIVRRPTNPRQAAEFGVGVVHQEQSLVPNLSVAENVLLGHEGDAVVGGFYRWRELRRKAEGVLRRVGCEVDPSLPVERLSFAERQMIEIAKAVGRVETADAAPLIVLDEPTSVLESDDVEVLEEEVNRLRELGAVIFVSHRLDEVLRFCDRVYVLRAGRIVAQRNTSDVREDELFELMVGRASTTEYFREADRLPFDVESPVLEAEGLTRQGAFSDVSFTVHEGEVLALVGTNGSGCEELSRAVFGAAELDSGRAVLDGKLLRGSGPRSAVRSGIGYVPSDRHSEGVIGGATVAENLTLAHNFVVRSGPFLRPRKQSAIAWSWIERLKVRPPKPGADIARLSGGNQQKVVLGKWLVSGDLTLLILDHPTRGLDPGAKEDVYGLIRELCASGMAVLLLADSLEEAIGLSHTIIVLRDGAVTGRFSCEDEDKPRPVDLLERMV
ncbi:sugar ABC transporter ATP-binding protein [Saccharopolyspora sp. NPDC049426]|uniref:sugar ABC transporter ATP-binding protein n=1 Tax=Saccharopolyspora sp. NPDC049426 TaxID=3155652 RepID=UPI00342601FF